MPSALPSVDLSPFATGADHGSTAAMEQAAIIDETCRELGFLLAVGHGIGESTKQALLDAMQGFFALPAEEKESISIAGAPATEGMSASVPRRSREHSLVVTICHNPERVT